MLLQRLVRSVWASLRPPREKGNTTTAISPTASTRACSRLPTPRRYRNREHLRYVAATSVSHLRPQTIRSASSSLPATAGARPQGERRIRRPACRSHHRAVHRAGDEQAWWTAAGIDPVKIARQLWRQTRLNDPQDPHHRVSRRGRVRPIASVSDGTRELRAA